MKDERIFFSNLLLLSSDRKISLFNVVFAVAGTILGEVIAHGLVVVAVDAVALIAVDAIAVVALVAVALIVCAIEAIVTLAIGVTLLFLLL